MSSAYKFALIAVFLWSTVATAFKIALEYLSPEMLVFYASFVSLLALFFVLLFQKRVYLIKDHLKNHSILTLFLGSINPFLYYLVLFKAYSLLPAQEAQTINYTWALVLAYLSVPFLGQKLRINDIVAGIICYFGVLIIATKGALTTMEFSNATGVVLALLSTILWAVYWILNTKSKSDPVVTLFCNFLFALPMIAIYILVTQEFTLPSIEGLLAATYVGLFEMGITFLFWLKAMQNTQNTAKVANLIFISPFLSLVFIYFILNEPIYIATPIGLLFIIFGLLLQQKKSSKQA